MNTLNNIGQDRLSQLPTELLFEIFQRCLDFSSLWSLLNTSSLLRAVFNNRATEIVNAVLSSTIPIPTQIWMRQVLALHTGSFSYSSYYEAMEGLSDRSQLVNTLVATPEQLHWFVRRSHYIHTLAHLCISKCIQNCLDSPLGQRKYPEGFKLPTWTEEQRTILAFWRVLFFNELKLTARRGHLDWSWDGLSRLESWGLHEYLGQYTPTYQGLTALWLIWELANPESSEECFWNARSLPFRLPKLPEGSEFGWTCQPLPSPRAIAQQPRNPSPEPRGMIKREPSQESHSKSSDKSLSDLYRSENDPSENEESGNESEPEESETEDSSSEFAPQLPPVSQPIVNRNPPNHWETNLGVRRFPPSSGHSILHYGKHSPGLEWQDLDREPLGVQFWRNMGADPHAGDGLYMHFTGYIKYGFAIWEEQRMIDLGLWSREALTDRVKYFRRWYTFLSEDNIALHNANDLYNNSENSEDDPPILCGTSLGRRR